MNSTPNYRRKFRPALASVFKTSLLVICRYTFVGTVLSISAGVALSAGCAHRDAMYVPDNLEVLAPPAGEDPSTDTSVSRLSIAKEPPQYRALEKDGVKGGEIVFGEEYSVLASERTASWHYGTPAYRVPLTGRNDKNSFSAVDPYFHDDDFSTGWPVAAEDSHSVAKFLFPKPSPLFEVGGFQVRFGFEDEIRGHDPWRR